MNRQPFPLQDVLPRELHDVILDFHWDQRLLWALELAVVDVPVAELEWHLRLPFWSRDEVPFQVTPLEVAADPTTHREQHLRAMSADLGFPLDAVRRPEGHLTILDGVHRLLRAHLDQQQSVRVRALPWEKLDAIAVRG